jgi:CheY-like chemotaxis protein
MSSKTINLLLADDDEDDRLLFKDAIDSLHMNTELVMVNNGLELLNLLEQEETPLPDMIFLDLNMPIMGGFESLARIRSNPRLQNLSVAIYSTSSSKKDIEESLIKGANIYINKPNDFGALKVLMKRIICTNWQYINSGFDTDSFILNL